MKFCSCNCGRETTEQWNYRLALTFLLSFLNKTKFPIFLQINGFWTKKTMDQSDWVDKKRATKVSFELNKNLKMHFFTRTNEARQLQLSKRNNKTMGLWS